MDIGTVRGLITIVMLVLFLGIWAWSWSRKRRADFDEASRLPLDDNARPPQRSDSKENRT
jgi:cytochrome c oxidase cbb3-type subunit IV